MSADDYPFFIEGIGYRCGERCFNAALGNDFVEARQAADGTRWGLYRCRACKRTWDRPLTRQDFKTLTGSEGWDRADLP